MKALLELDSRHPNVIGFIGGATGFFGWFLDHLGIITPAVICVGAIFGALASFLTFVIKIWKLWRAWNHRRRAQREAAEDDLPWDRDDDQFE